MFFRKVYLEYLELKINQKVSGSTTTVLLKMLKLSDEK